MRFAHLAVASACVLAFASVARAEGVASVTVEEGALVLRTGEQSLSVAREGGALTLATRFGGATLEASILHRTGWTKPGGGAWPPSVRQEGEVAVARITYPVPDDRQLVLELAAWSDPAPFVVTSRLLRTRSTADDYYYWATSLSFDHYGAPGPDGPQRIECLPDEWDPIPWRPWLFAPLGEGGIAVLPTNVSGRTPGAEGTLFLHALPRNGVIGPGDALEARFGLGGAATEGEAAGLASHLAEANPTALAPWDDPESLPTCDYGAPAPSWLTGADHVNGYYRPAAQWTDEVVRERLSSAPLVIGSTPNRAALERCHGAGVRLLHYVTYTCLLDTEMQVREGGHVYPEWSESLDCGTRDLALHPEWTCIDAAGGIQHDAWGLSFHHPGLLNTCLHQEGLQAAAERQVGMLTDLGFDGVFVDLAGPTPECYGPGFGKHTHPSERTNTEAWEDTLTRIYAAAKARGQDRVVIQNGVTYAIPGHWASCDAQMLEGLPYRYDSTELGPSWPEMLWHGRRAQEAARHGKTTVILPYLGAFDAATVREPALLSYAFARLFGLLWADYYSLLDVPGAEDLARAVYGLRLGAPLEDAGRQGSVWVRRFERGAVVLNPGLWAVTAELDVPGDVRIVDLGYGEVAPTAGGIALALPSLSGRVLTW